MEGQWARGYSQTHLACLVLEKTWNHHLKYVEISDSVRFLVLL